MLRRLFIVLRALSLVLCVATVVLWVRSLSKGEHIEWVTWRWEGSYRNKPAYGSGGPEVFAGAGGLEISTERWVVTDETRIELAREKPKWRRREVFQGVRPPMSRVGGRVDALYGFAFFRFSGVSEESEWRGSTVVLPYWFLTLLFAAFSVTTLTTRLKRSWRVRRLRLGLCPSCGYDMRATPDRCPECGKVPASKGP